MRDMTGVACPASHRALVRSPQRCSYWHLLILVVSQHVPSCVTDNRIDLVSHKPRLLEYHAVRFMALYAVSCFVFQIGAIAR